MPYFPHFPFARRLRLAFPGHLLVRKSGKHCPGPLPTIGVPGPESFIRVPRFPKSPLWGQALEPTPPTLDP